MWVRFLVFSFQFFVFSGVRSFGVDLRRGAGNTLNLFVHEGPRRAAKKVKGKTFIHEGPRRAAKKVKGKTFIREGPLRATEKVKVRTFIREGPLRTTKNILTFFSCGGRFGSFSL